MRKVLTGLITLALILVAAVTLLAADTLGEQAALNQAQERRHAEELHNVRMQVEREQAAQAVMSARRTQPAKDAATGILFVGGASTVAGLGWYLVQLMRRKTQLVWPNDAGLFPQIPVELPNGATAYHDPNRSPTHITVYSPTADGGVAIQPVMLDGTQDAVRQAAAVQLVRASVSGGAQLTEDAERVARKFLPGDGGDLGARRPQMTTIQTKADNLKRLEVSGDESTGTD